MFELGDLKLSIVNGINVFFISLIIILTFYKRKKYAGQVEILVPEEDIPDLENIPKVQEADNIKSP